MFFFLQREIDKHERVAVFIDQPFYGLQTRDGAAHTVLIYLPIEKDLTHSIYSLLSASLRRLHTYIQAVRWGDGTG